MAFIHFLILIGVLGSFLFFLLNHLRRLKKAQAQFKMAFVQIDLELQKRNLRIPELIEISKSTLSQERALLELLVKNRNEASAALQKAAIDPSGTESIQRLHQAEKEFQIVLAEFLQKTAIQSNLMNQPQYIELLKTERESQKQIQSAIESYNLSATDYNNHCNRFPGSLLTRLLGFEKATLFL
jgi:LemA protein